MKVNMPRRKSLKFLDKCKGKRQLHSRITKKKKYQEILQKFKTERITQEKEHIKILSKCEIAFEDLGEFAKILDF